MTLVDFTTEDLEELRAIRWHLINMGDIFIGVRLDGLIGRMHDARIEELRQQILRQQAQADGYYQGRQHERRHLRAMGAIPQEDA